MTVFEVSLLTGKITKQSLARKAGSQCKTNFSKNIRSVFSGLGPNVISALGMYFSCGPDCVSGLCGNICAAENEIVATNTTLPFTTSAVGRVVQGHLLPLAVYHHLSHTQFCG